MFYRIANGQAPKYLIDIFPQKVKDVVPYPLRNANDLIVPRHRIESYKRSFIVYGAGLWNQLDLDTRNSNSLSGFTTAIIKPFNQFPNDHKDIYNLFCYGDRFPNIIHSRLRVGCSKLHSDLCVNLRVIDNPSCSCGALSENAFHYFMECPLLNDLRMELFESISAICQCHINLELLLYGNKDLNLQSNKRIFSKVHDYIQLSNRFSD